MGNSSSSSRGQHEDTVDFGHLVPQVFTGQRDWNQSIAVQAICERRLAPFYRPLEDYDESWDEDQIMAARKEPPAPAEGEEGGSNGAGGGGGGRQAEPASHTSRSHHKRTSNAGKEPSRHPEAAIYRGAVECPICFLYYPPNINYSRCCEQPICTECFVQIKRAEPTPQHLESEPAACPYCVQDNFGVVYTPPRWRAGIGSEGGLPPSPTMQASAGNPPPRRRRKSFGANDPDVVTIDYIRPDWEAKLAAVKAAVARRANRRIIMRQVGDRLIPVGVTSGRIQLLPDGADGQGGEGEGNGGGGSGSRRSRRRHQQNQDLGQFLGQMGMGGQDLEELMIMEAMRLSLVDEEDRQRKEKEKQAKEEAEKIKGGSGSSSAADNNGASSSAQDGPSNRPSVDRSAPASSSSLSPSSGLGQSGTPPSRSRTSLDVPGSDRDPVGGHRRSMSRNRSPSPAFSALGAALKSAASTASALVGSNGQGSGTSSGHQTPKAGATGPGQATAATPSPKQEQPVPSVAATMSSPVGPGSSTSVFITPDVSNKESVPGAWGDEVAMALAPITSSSPGAGASSSAPGQSVNVNGEAQHAEGSHPVPIPAANTVPQPTEASFADKRPDVLHLESFASSVAPNEADAYEALDSSPESTRSREPLLDSEAPVAGQPGSSQT